MSSISLINLPGEIIYLVFEYLNKEDIAYSFFGLNNYFSSIVTNYIGDQFNLTKISNDIIFHYCLSTVLPLIGFNLCYLSIGHPYCLSTYINYLKNYCPNLDKLHIYCCSEKEDIRYYIAHLTDHRCLSLTFIFNGKIVGEQISLHLLHKFSDKEFEQNSKKLSLILHLSSMNDLILLKRYSESNYLSDGLYMIECISTGEWLTDCKDDFCIMSKKFHRERIFSIKQNDKEQCCLEYELYNEQTQRCLTVLKCYEDEEHWTPSSMVSTYRKESIYSCSTFTFEKIDDQNQYYIRPCYPRAKRLQVSGNRIIVSLSNNESTPNHCFRLHRVS